MTVAVRTLVPPTVSVVGFASTVSVAGGPGLKTTEAEPDASPVVAVMWAVPASVEVMVEVAMPPLVEPGESTVPRLEVKVTKVPSATGLLY